jgi:tetratricopeptide (TPR) repeat protein
MTSSWDDRVDAFWALADRNRPEAALSEMAALISERPGDDPEALYEWASVHDFLEQETEAVPLYQRALELGLTGSRRPQAVIQLASSLRNIGEPEAAVRLLEGAESDSSIEPAARAFLALALHDCGQHAQALQVALQALAPTLPAYGRVVAAYADELRPRP